MISRRGVLIGAGVGAAALGTAAYKLSGPGGRGQEGRSIARPVATEHNPPEAADVVIIGGGIVGVLAAFHLARRGVSVVLCEKGVIAGEASGRAVGQVVSGGLDVNKSDLIAYSKREWAGLNEAVGGETGYRANGYLSPFLSSQDRGFWEGWLAEMGKVEPQGTLLSAGQVKQMIGEGKWLGGYYNPTDGGTEPRLAAPAIAEGAKRLGAKLVAPCAVRGLETSAGRVSAVVTEKGTIRTERVLLASGCWSTLFASNLGIRLPGLNMFSMVRSVYGVDGPPGTGDLPGVSWRKQLDGGYTVSVVGGTAPIVPATFRFGLDYWQAFREAHWEIKPNFGRYFFEQLGVPGRWEMDEVSPFERLRILEPSSNGPLADQALERIRQHLPAFRTLKRGPVWGGALVATPDNMPTAGEVKSLPGLFLATGLTYGMTFGPAVAALIADLMTGRRPAIDPRPYRYERYIDGTELEFRP